MCRILICRIPDGTELVVYRIPVRENITFTSRKHILHALAVIVPVPHNNKENKFSGFMILIKVPVLSGKYPAIFCWTRRPWRVKVSREKHAWVGEELRVANPTHVLAGDEAVDTTGSSKSGTSLKPNLTAIFLPFVSGKR
jgi:hypothetical protein